MNFQKDPPLTANGMLPLPQKPGFGIELDETKIEKKEIVSA
jgi:L-alanine-DL-glutamate epimerase-like enolase superfamily enzyme